MRKNSKNNFGFTLAELAATLGVFALAATILTPAFSGTPATSNSNVTVSSDSPAGASPFTPPVNAILVNVTNDATGVTLNRVVTDPSATSTTISGLDPQGTYTVEVAKRNQAGKSPAAVAKVNYIKVGETVVDTTRVEAQLRNDTSRPIMVDNPNDRRYVNGAATAWQQKFSHFGKHTVSVRAFVQRHSSPVYTTVQRSAQVRIAPFERTVSVRVAPFTRQVRIAPFERTVRVAPFTRQVRIAPFERAVTSTCTQSYRCGTADRPRTCTRNVSCTTWVAVYNYRTEDVFNYSTEAVFNYRTEDVFNYSTTTEAVFNYRTDTWNEQVFSHVAHFSAPAAKGTCAANGTTGTWTGVTYACDDTWISEVQDNPADRRYVNDLTRPIAWEQVFTGLGKMHNGQYEQKLVDVVIPGSRIDDVFGSRTTQTAVKAEAGQLLLNSNSVQNVRGVWKSATVAAKGAGTSQTVGSRVNFTTAKLVTLNGTQYLVVDARAAR